MRASSKRSAAVMSALGRVTGEREITPGNQANIDLAAFIRRNAAEVVDAAKKGLIIRASLLKTAATSKGIRHCETGLKRLIITGRSPVTRSLTIE